MIERVSPLTSSRKRRCANRTRSCTYTSCGARGRLPLITPDLREPIYRCILEQARKHRCEVIAIGGIEDHVHVLVEFHPMARVSEVVQHMKGASSHLVSQVLTPGEFFKWQGAYGAFSLSKRQVPNVQRYIHDQEEHHGAGTTIAALERTSE